MALASGMERALRMSAAEAAMMDRRKKSRSRASFNFRKWNHFHFQVAGILRPLLDFRVQSTIPLSNMAPSKVAEADEFVNIWMDTGAEIPATDRKTPTKDFYSQWVDQSTSRSSQLSIFPIRSPLQHLQSSQYLQ
jgi:hypothetical protein